MQCVCNEFTHVIGIYWFVICGISCSFLTLVSVTTVPYCIVSSSERFAICTVASVSAVYRCIISALTVTRPQWVKIYGNQQGSSVLIANQKLVLTFLLTNMDFNMDFFVTSIYELSLCLHHGWHFYSPFDDTTHWMGTYTICPLREIYSYLSEKFHWHWSIDIAQVSAR